MFCASIFLAYEVERKDFPYAKFLLQNTDNMWNNRWCADKTLFCDLHFINFIYKCLCCACTYAGSYRIEQNRIGFYCHCLCTAKLWINYYKLLQVSCKQVNVVVYLVINVSYTALQ